MNLDALLKPIDNKADPCKLQKLIDGLEDPYKNALIELVNLVPENGGLSSKQLSMRIKEAGFGVSENTILRHRGKSCACKGLTND